MDTLQVNIHEAKTHLSKLIQAALIESDISTKEFRGRRHGLTGRP